MVVTLSVDMRNYILTENERDVITALIEDGVRLDGFRMLKTRSIKNLPRLREDIELIEKFLEALDSRARYP